MDLSGKKILVFGSGKSGVGASRLLIGAGAVPVVYDSKADLDCQAVRDRIGLDVQVIAGTFPDEILSSIDACVMSPGVPCDIPPVEHMRAAGIPVWSEIELAYRVGKGKILAVTGTNGKTTTVTLLGEMMKNYFPEVYVVGNIGTPYTDVALQQTEKAWTVIECSSFQLETIDTFHPVASAITNITEDHLNRHHTMEEYIRCKERIAENQTQDDICVLNYEDPVLRAFGEKSKVPVVYFSSRRKLDRGIWLDGHIIRMSDGSQTVDVIDTEKLQILGLHNYENVMVAAAMAHRAGVPVESIQKTAYAFKGVAHRIEYVTEINGVKYYNDSKGTNPDAAIKGIQAMNRPTCLIGGGFDKQLSFDDWIRAFDGKVRYFALIGQTKEQIAETAIRCGFPKENIAFFDNLEQAVKACAAHAEPGDAVLLSPACASWGQFDNYEQRGDMFKQYVRELAEA